jgi:hypothetical protein
MKPRLLKKLGRHIFPCGVGTWIGLFQCYCGKEFKTFIRSVRHGHTKSCGCLNLLKQRESGRKRRIHGLCHSGTYNSWKSARQRCENPRARSYERYGAAGVTFHPPWRDFRLFLLDVGERPEGTTLDRIDPFGNYEPGNCRWATPKMQRHNRRKNRIKEVANV